MKKTKINIAIGCLYLLVLSSSFFQPALAETTNSRLGFPGRRVAAASRGQCTRLPGSSNQLTAITPNSQLVSTLSDRPTFFVYVPAIPASTEIEFVLRDEGANQIYKTSLMGMNQPGIVPFSLPTSSQPLVVDQTYSWYVSIICEPENRGNDIFVGGVVKRVPPNASLSQALQQSSPENKLALYIQENFWYEAMQTLVSQQQLNPRDINLGTQWKQLLQSVDLGNFSQQPILILQNADN